MRKSLHMKLAVHNLRSSYRLTVPYILSGILAYALCYIVLALASDEGLASSYGGRTAGSLLGYGCVIAALTSFLFLFSVSRYLIKQRGREFALYGILGMDKKNVMLVLFAETVMTLAAVTAGGLAVGVVFSKGMQLLLLRMMHISGNIEMHFSMLAFGTVTVLFAAIYILSFVFGSFRVAVSSPVTLLHTKNAGDAGILQNRWVERGAALCGIVCLALGYLLAQQADSVGTAAELFMPAVILVIIATHLLFLAGSSVLMRVLKANKKYYYQQDHFISLSGMMHRMRRNASGLATVCILACMVIVTVSVTFAGYYGIERSLNKMYPRQIMLYGTVSEPELIPQLEEAVQEQAAQFDAENFQKREWRGVQYRMKDGKLIPNDGADTEVYVNFSEATEEDGFVLAEDEVAVCSAEEVPFRDTLVLGDRTYRIKEVRSGEELDATATQYGGRFNLVVYIRDMDAVDWTVNTPDRYKYTFGFDMDASDEKRLMSALDECAETIRKIESVYSIMAVSRKLQETETASVFGSLLFLGVILGTMFLIITVLIIYYKQMSEGYEDIERFRQMQNVGLSEEEVRRTIRSQVLRTFFIPLGTALIHVLFAYHLVSYFVQGFGTIDQNVYILSLAVTSAVFTIIYMLVYRETSRVYYHIVQQA